MRGRGLTSFAAATLAALAFAPAAPGQDDRVGRNDFGGFRNVLPAGQGETVNLPELVAAQGGSRPASFTNQLAMYTDAIFEAPGLDNADLDRLFKPAGFGVRSADVASTVSPRPGVTIVRDSQFGVPHVYGEARADVAYGAGYASAQDRLFLMDVLRHTGRGRLTELAGPGTGDANVRMDAQQLLIADYSEEELQRMIDVGAAQAGAEGQQILADLTAYVEGINKYIAEARSDPNKMPGEYAALGHPGPADWKPTDTVAVASLIGGIFGRGGGSEAEASQVLAAARNRFGRRNAPRVFRDFRREDDLEAPPTTRRRFPFDRPGRVNGRAVAITDLGSLRQRNPIASGSDVSVTSASDPSSQVRDLLNGGLVLPKEQSNALLVHGSRTSSGRSIAVMGPQVGYFSPQILMEMGLHGPGYDTRGATFPGISLYVLLGRGQDFAWSATTATTDVVDEFAERLCNPDGSRPTINSTHYTYRGRCIPFEARDHVIRTPLNPTSPEQPREIRMQTLRSVHGPIQGWATVRGDPVAIAEARSTYFHELESAIAFKRLNGNEVRNPGTFQRAMNRVNFAFNWFYVDDNDIAYLQSGWFPRRARGTDPSLPAWGTGEYDWQGFDPAAYTSRRLPYRALPKDRNPAQDYIVNWNNKQAPGWRSADDQWSYSSVHRSEILEKPLRSAMRRGDVDLARLTQVMQLGATVDLRGREVYPLIRRVIGQPTDAETAQLLGFLDVWERAGAHRRDVDRDNVYEHSAAVALMDAWWDPMVRGVFTPVLGSRLLEHIRDVIGFGSPPGPGGSSFGSGWWGYLEKDLRRMLGMRVRQPLRRRYCGRGSRVRCRRLLIGTLKDAARRVREIHNVTDLNAVRIPATCGRPRNCDQIEFVTAGGVSTPPIPFQNRPTFQQVVEVQGHR
jgi:acyl-homoserine lactone acylase PvdQ